jgi:hypothetical protein
MKKETKEVVLKGTIEISGAVAKVDLVITTTKTLEEDK